MSLEVRAWPLSRLPLLLLLLLLASWTTTVAAAAAALPRQHRLYVEDTTTAPPSRLGDADYRALLARRVAELNPRGEAIHVTAASADRDACVNASDATPLPTGRQTMLTVTTRDGTERHVAVYIPRSLARQPSQPHRDDTATTARPAALLVLFHGLNDECARFMNNTGLLDAAERDGFVVASACGSMGWLGVAWNAGMCCGFFGDKPDDVGFARDLVGVLRASVCIDEGKVMAAGFSNGAMLAEVLACSAADVYSAVASVGGVVEMRPGNSEGLHACDAAVQHADERTQRRHHHHHHRNHSYHHHHHHRHDALGAPRRLAPSTRRASVLMVHGDADEMVPWGGNHVLGFPSMEQNLQAWAVRNGCDAASPRTTINNTGFVNTLYDACHVNATAAQQALAHHHRGHHHHGHHHHHNNNSYHHRHPYQNHHHHHHHSSHDCHRDGGGGGGRDNCDVPHHLEQRRARDAPARNTTVELVRAYNGAHAWPETGAFSTTDYILAFAQRVFGGW